MCVRDYFNPFRCKSQCSPKCGLVNETSIIIVLYKELTILQYLRLHNQSRTIKIRDGVILCQIFALKYIFYGSVEY